jgi:hypothetical protein
MEPSFQQDQGRSVIRTAAVRGRMRWKGSFVVWVATLTLKPRPAKDTDRDWKEGEQMKGKE